MDIKEVAFRLVELCRAREFEKAWDELFAPGWETRELVEWGGQIRHGKEEAKKASDEWQKDIIEIHELLMSDPLISDDSFACTMTIDSTSNSRGRIKETELCVYKVKDSKIIMEQFF